MKMITIAQAKERINQLEKLQMDALRLQDMCLDKNSQVVAITRIETDSKMSTDLRTFASITAQLAIDEIDRIQQKIADTEIDIS